MNILKANKAEHSSSRNLFLLFLSLSVPKDATLVPFIKPSRKRFLKYFKLSFVVTLESSGWCLVFSPFPAPRRDEGTIKIASIVDPKRLGCR